MYSTIVVVVVLAMVFNSGLAQKAEAVCVALSQTECCTEENKCVFIQCKSSTNATQQIEGCHAMDFDATTVCAVNTSKQVCPVAPTFTKPLQEANVEIGSNVTLSATVAGDPFPAVEWKTADKVLSEARYTKTSNATSGEVSLSFTSATEADKGEYTLTVTNYAGAVNATVNVQVHRECDELSQEDCCKDIHKACYFIACKDLADAAHTGCHARTDNLTAVCKPDTVTITCPAVPVLTMGPAQSVNVGDDVSLTATVDGTITPFPTASWFFGDKAVNETAKFAKTQNETAKSYTLSIKNVSLADSGNYSLSVANYAGSDQKPVALTVTALTTTTSQTTTGSHTTSNVSSTGSPTSSSAPTADITATCSPANVTAVVDSAAIFKCTYVADFTPTADWKFNGASLNGSNSLQELDPAQKVALLVIKHVSDTSKGSYKLTLQAPKKTPYVATFNLDVTESAPAPQSGGKSSGGQKFDGASFIGGIVLCAGLVAIGILALKFYKAKTERTYQTL